MNWAFRKKFIYGSLFALIVLAIGFLFAYPFTHREPTCFDGRKNGEETGIDCGGLCAKYCPDQLRDPVVSWARSFSAAPGIYNAVAYIENRNDDASIQSVSYRFRLYDETGVLIGERTGSTYIGPKGASVIFESGIQVGMYDPTRTVFEFTSPIEWSRTDIPDTVLLSGNAQFTRATGNPRVSAEIRNTSLSVVSNIEAAVLLYGADGNVFAASRTVIDKLGAGAGKTVYFSWPQGFAKDPVRIEIIPKFDPGLVRKK